MTPEQQIKLAILSVMLDEFSDYPDQLPEDFKALLPVTSENIDDAWYAADDCAQDCEGDFRSGEIETDVAAEYSRDFESRSVACKMADGTWIGWTYYYGGGKHSEPEAMDWMCDAYELTCVEVERTVTVREFTKVVTPE